MRYDRDRGSAARRGYDRRWRRFRIAVLRERGWRCENCNRRPFDTSKLHVHHEVPVEEEPERRLDRTNVKVWCHTCHSRHHGFEV